MQACLNEFFQLLYMWTSLDSAIIFESYFHWVKNYRCIILATAPFPQVPLRHFIVFWLVLFLFLQINLLSFFFLSLPPFVLYWMSSFFLAFKIFLFITDLFNYIISVISGCVFINWLFSSLWLIFSYSFARLVVFRCMPDIWILLCWMLVLFIFL